MRTAERDDDLVRSLSPCPCLPSLSTSHASRRLSARPGRETRLWASPLPNSSSLLRRPRPTPPPPQVPAGCTRFNARPSCRSPNAGGRRLASEFGHTTMHADVPSADRATERASPSPLSPSCMSRSTCCSERSIRQRPLWTAFPLLLVFLLRGLFDTGSGYLSICCASGQSVLRLIIVLSFVSHLYDILDVDPPPSGSRALQITNLGMT